MSCENCGLPDGAHADKGHRLQITRRAENNFRRDSKTMVWVCSRECGVQALAISQYGIASHKWPVTLAQYRGTVKRQHLMEAV